MHVAIKGYEGLYNVTEDGRVFTVPHSVTTGVATFLSKCKERKQHANRSGYMQIWLHKDGKTTGYLVHRLVAIAFLPNKNNLPQVNHKNGIKDDNRVDNLEWITQLENVRHSYRELGRVNLPGELRRGTRPVKQYSLDGKLLKIHGTLHQAATSTGILVTAISNCIKGRSQSAGGYKWVALPLR